MISATTSNAEKKAKTARMRIAAAVLKELSLEEPWVGTISELSVMLASADSTSLIPPARLAMWLRQRETTLWWDYGVSIRFSRTGRHRLVHVSRRGELSAQALVQK